MHEPWIARLEAGDPEGAWDVLLGRYRRLIFAAIRHYTSETDEVMDVFACVCEALRADDFRRLRAYAARPVHQARFGTWLVTVVRHLTIDWIRHSRGRGGLVGITQGWPPLRRRIFELVFVRRCSHVEAYEMLHVNDWPGITFQKFLGELRATYRAVVRRRTGHVLRELAPPSLDLPGPSYRDADVVTAVDLEEALGSLDSDQRLLLHLRVVDEVPAAVVADIMGLPNAKAVYNRMHRTLGELRTRIGGRLRQGERDRR